MTKASFSDRIDLYKFLSARVTFEKALSILDYINCNNLTKKDVLFYPIMLAFFILYGRPFKQRKHCRLSSILISNDCIELHKDLLKWRDKLYAHMDTDEITQNGENLGSIVITAINGKLTPGLSYHFPIGESIIEIHQLIDAIINKCNYHSKKIWDRLFKKKNWPVDGTYILNTSKDNDSILINVK